MSLRNVGNELSDVSDSVNVMGYKTMQLIVWAKGDWVTVTRANDEQFSRNGLLKPAGKCYCTVFKSYNGESTFGMFVFVGVIYELLVNF